VHHLGTCFPAVLGDDRTLYTCESNQIDKNFSCTGAQLLRTYELKFSQQLGRARSSGARVGLLGAGLHTLLHVSCYLVLQNGAQDIKQRMQLDDSKLLASNRSATNVIA
jgi:hypothetical protein